MAKRFTLASAKSFMKKNADSLYILTRSRFDGSVDGNVSTGQKEYTPIEKTANAHANNLGYNGVWFVLGGGDYFTPMYAQDSDTVVGFECYNCCGNFFIRNFA